jgi:hypothetical protein
MTSQSPRIYTYKITFEEVPYYYYGVHKEKVFNEEYWGTPKTNKWCWALYTPKKQILQLFDFTDGGWIEAQEVEKKLIRPFYQTDKWCLNESIGGFFTLEQQKQGGKIGGKLTGKLNYEKGIGLGSITKEQRIENGKKASKEDKSRAGKLGANKLKELGLGIFALTLEQRRENGRKASRVGRSKNGKKVCSQKWMCLETGYITNSGALSNYQKHRGIDTSKRKRIE